MGAIGDISANVIRGARGARGSVGKKPRDLLVPNLCDHLERTGSWGHAKIQRASMGPIGDIGAIGIRGRRTIDLDLI